MEENGGARPRYIVLAYDREALAVLSLAVLYHDFTGAVLTLTRRAQEYRGRPEVSVRLAVQHHHGLPGALGPSSIASTSG